MTSREKDKESGFMSTFKILGSIYYRGESFLPLLDEPNFFQIYFIGDETFYLNQNENFFAIFYFIKKKI